MLLHAALENANYLGATGDQQVLPPPIHRVLLTNISRGPELTLPMLIYQSPPPPHLLATSSVSWISPSCKLMEIPSNSDHY